MSKHKTKDKKDKKPFLSTFSKVIVFLSLIYGWVLTTVSYIWAYKGYQPLTDLSSTIVSTIVSPTITYLCSNALMTIFEKNQLSFSTPITAIQSGIVPTYQDASYMTQDLSDNDMHFSQDDTPLSSVDSFEFSVGSGRGDDED